MMMASYIIETLSFVGFKLKPLLDGVLPNIGLNSFVEDALEAPLFDAFENARDAFSNNDETLLLYGLIVAVSFIIGIGVYNTFHPNKENNG